MKRLLMASALACALFASASAGEIPSGGIAPPPQPPDPPGITSMASPGDIPTGGLTGAIPSDGLAQQAEDALLSGCLTVVGWLT